MSSRKAESAVLESLKIIGHPIREDQYHIIASILEAGGVGFGFVYRERDWNRVDARFHSACGRSNYSSKLHATIESLVEKGILRRDPSNPICIEYIGSG